VYSSRYLCPIAFVKEKPGFYLWFMLRRIWTKPSKPVTPPSRRFDY